MSFTSLAVNSVEEQTSSVVVHFADTPLPPYVLGDEVVSKIIGGRVIALVEEVFSRIPNVEVEFHMMPWPRVLSELEDGSMDAVSMIARTPEREQFLDYSIPLRTSSQVMFYLRSEFQPHYHWQSLADLEGSFIGVVKDDYSDYRLQSLLEKGYPLSVERISGSPKQLFGMLLRKRIDLFSYNLESGKALLKEYNWQDKIGYAPKPVVSEHYYLAFSKKLPYRGLLKQVNAVLSELLDNSELENIMHPEGHPITYLTF